MRGHVLVVGACLILASALVAGSGPAPAGDTTVNGFDLAAAIALAEPGEEIRVPAGTYVGPVRIDKPLRLHASAGVVIDGEGKGTVVEITASDVTFDGFTVRNTGISLDRENSGIAVTAPRAMITNNHLEDVLFGVYLKEAAGSTLRGNVIGSKLLDPPRRGDGIRLWESSDCVVEDNTIRDSRDAVMWFSDRTQIRRNHVSGGRYGMHFMYSDDNVLEDNLVEDNSVGAFLMYSHDLTLRRNVFARNRGPSGFGIGLKDMDGITAEDNILVGNRVGLHVDNSPSQFDITHVFRSNVIGYNDVGIAFTPSVQRNVFVENAFLDNIEQVAVLGSGRFTGNTFTLDGRGNWWSDYRGFDLDEDGIGDLPHEVEGLFEALMDREPRLRLFLFSPSQLAVDLAARAFPIVAPRPRARDDAPLMTPPIVRAKNRPTITRTRPWPAAAVLGLVGALCVGAGLLPIAPPARSRSSETSAPMIELVDISKRFRRCQALANVSLTVEAGEAVALWGSNGAGKTTLIRCLLGLLPFKGTARVAGLDVRRRGKAARRLIGYVPQETALESDIRVREAVAFFARLRGADRAACARAITRADLDDHARKRVRQLSGGMRQRLALEIALLTDPPVLILDEPTASLDAAARARLLERFARLHAEGKTILFTSHRPTEIADVADRVVTMESGRIVTRTSSDHQPQDSERTPRMNGSAKRAGTEIPAPLVAKETLS